MSFTQYTPAPGKTGVLFLTIRRSGFLTLSAAAHRALGKPEWITLHYDADHQRIGIRAAQADTSGALRCWPMCASGTTMLVSGAGFCHCFGIDLTETRRYAARMEGDYIVADLNSEPLPIGAQR